MVQITGLFLQHSAVGNGALNKFGNYFQWRSELLKFIMFFFYVGKGAMNAIWELHDDACTVYYTLRDETSANTPCFSYPYGAMILITATYNWFPNCQSKNKEAL
jgi:hypothetical protein